MKYILFVLFTFLALYVCRAQQNTAGFTTIIVGKTVSYQQSDAWTLSSSKHDKSKGIDIMNFQRTGVALTSGAIGIPTQSCLVETVRTTDIKQYSTSNLVFFQKRPDFKILKIITHTDGLLTIPYGIGYWIVYRDEKKVLHKVIIIHALNSRGKGLQFFIDCPEDGFVTLEEEITEVIRSLHFL